MRIGIYRNLECIDIVRDYKYSKSVRVRNHKECDLLVVLTRILDSSLELTFVYYLRLDCPMKCGTRGCLSDDTCCHPTCLGGCDGPSPSECHVCANFSLGYDDKRTCVERCPANTYEVSPARHLSDDTCCHHMCLGGYDGSALRTNAPAWTDAPLTPYEVSLTRRMLHETCCHLTCLGGCDWLSPSDGHVYAPTSRSVTCFTLHNTLYRTRSASHPSVAAVSPLRDGARVPLHAAAAERLRGRCTARARQDPRLQALQQPLLRVHLSQRVHGGKPPPM